MQHSGDDDIVDVLTMAGEEARILPARHRLAHEPTGGGSAHRSPMCRHPGRGPSGVEGIVFTPLSRGRGRRREPTSPDTVGQATAWQRGLPDARLEVIDGAGHALSLEEPDRLAALARDFLS
jgi:pimeloyl-ACP methyl ester carboxylesterase